MNHLTNINLFKQLHYPSWSFTPYGDMGITIKKHNQATDWKQYILANKKAGLVGTGYKVDAYKNLDGLKKSKINKLN